MKKVKTKGFYALIVSLAVILIISLFAVYLVCFAYPTPYRDIVLKNSSQFALEPYLVYSVIKTESGFKTNVKSSKGAVGLMQITPSTAEYIAEKLATPTYNLEDVETNVKFGCFYLRYLINKFKSLNTAITAYNAGEGNVSKWLKDSKCSTDGINLKYIPFKESRNYLKKIRKSLANYRKLYGNTLDKSEKNK